VGMRTGTWRAFRLDRWTAIMSSLAFIDA